MRDDVRTWHYGLVARWWAEFNEGGDDLEFFRDAIKRCGEPALDAGCGTGRLLLPFLRLGLDVDGSDVSTDMLGWCATKAEAEGLSVNLYPQAMHELDLPRRYQTVVVCGSFGIGGTRATDLKGLRRIHAHLEPGGTLVMDHHLPNRTTAKHRPRVWDCRANGRNRGIVVEPVTERSSSCGRAYSKLIRKNGLSPARSLSVNLLMARKSRTKRIRS